MNIEPGEFVIVAIALFWDFVLIRSCFTGRMRLWGGFTVERRRSPILFVIFIPSALLGTWISAHILSTAFLSPSLSLGLERMRSPN